MALIRLNNQSISSVTALPSEIDVGNLTASGTVTATAISSTKLVVQYVVTKLTGQQSWSHSAYDEWHLED